LPCLLYCVTLVHADSVANLIGVSDQPVLSQDSGDVRVYWSEIADPTAVLEGPTRKASELKYKQILREIVARVTPVAFPFPAMGPDVDALDAIMGEQEGRFVDTLTRLGETFQYELIASWDADDLDDLARPVSGREYLARRQKSEARVAAIDSKLKTVTAGLVRQWRSRQERRSHQWFALVARNDRERFLRALRNAGPSQGVHLRLSGPWPPSEFGRVPEGS